MSFQHWGHNFTVIPELGNHLLFQPKPQGTLAVWDVCGWETLSTTEPRAYLECLRAADPVPTITIRSAKATGTLVKPTGMCGQFCLLLA